MSWAKLDDRYDDNPKIKRVWRRHPAAVGLHTMAVTYACRHELDGVVDLEWIEEKLPVKRDRETVCDALVEAGLFEERPGGFMVHHFLEYNPSRADLVDRREKDRRRKESTGNPRGVQAGSVRNPSGKPAESVETHARPGAQVGTGREEVPASSQGEAQLTRERADELVGMLAARWPDFPVVALENAVEMYPAVSPVQGARLALAWASDETWEIKSGPATFRAALRKLDTERPKTDEKRARRKRGAEALRALRELPA